MGELTDFIADVSTFKADISIEAKLYIVSTFLIASIILIFIIKKNVNSYILQDNYLWYASILIFNLASMTAILYYYMTKSKNMTGDIGRQGDKGLRGGRGKFITCSFCKWNIYTQQTKDYQKVVSLVNIPNTERWSIALASQLNQDVEKYFNHIKYMISEDDINTKTTLEAFDAIIKSFGTQLRDTLLITYLAIADMNNAITGAEKPGSIYRASGKVGYFPLGDTPFKTDNPTKLNSFVMSGDIRHPVKYNKLSHLVSYYIDDYLTDEVLKEPELEEFTIWQPQPPTGYVALADTIQFGKKQPDLNQIVCLKETCTKRISVDELDFMYIYWGSVIPIINNLKKLEPKSDDLDYIKKLNFFSVWRTPLNNIIVNVASLDDLFDNTLIFNIINARGDYLDDTGKVKKSAIKIVKSKLKEFTLPTLIKTLYINIYFYSYYLEQTETYIRRNVKHIEKIKNEKKKKDVVNKIFKRLFLDKMANVPTLIAKTKTMFDLTMLLFPDGFDTYVAKDESLVNTMGTPLLAIQKNLILILKCIFPPNRPVYMIKNECLSYITIDENRQKLIKTLSQEIIKNQKFVDKVSENPTEFCESQVAVMQRINQKDELLSKYLSHIDNYQYKLENLDFDGITNERLKTLIEAYESLNQYLVDDCKL